MVKTDVLKDSEGLVFLKYKSVPTKNLPENYTDREVADQPQSNDVVLNNINLEDIKNGKKIVVRNASLGRLTVSAKPDGGNMDNLGFPLEYDDDINEDERRFYLKLFPSVDLVKEKKTHCTSCNVHLGTAPANESNILMHPILKVSQCKKCNEFYNSGEFCKGEDGSELYCRWCGQGGEVYCCAKCPFVFCKACISINLAKSLVTDIRDNENWNCFVCSPKITWPIRATHWALKNYIAKQKKLIKNTAISEVEQRRLMKKDSSTCCFQSKNDDGSDASTDSDATLLQKRNPIVLNKRKAESNITNIGEPKPKQQPPPLVTKTISLPIISSPKQTQGVATNTTTTPLSSTNLIQAHKSRPFILNNSITVQLNKNLVPVAQPQTLTTFKPPNTGTVQSNQSAVKIVQLQQSGQNQQPRMQMQFGSQAAPHPPPLLIRNRGVQIRPHINVVSTPSQNVNQNQIQNRMTTTTVQLGVRQTSEHAPVYHNIGGFCIDLNSAAQHDSIRLPNGKLIQVKKSTTNNANQNSNLRQQIPSGVLSPVANQPQHQFTITQTPPPVQAQIHNVSPPQVTFQTTSPIQSHQQAQSIQTVPASTVLPNASGQVQIINGNLVQTLAGNIGPQTRPLLVKNLYPNTPIGKARSQLQNQIFSAMEICQHLSSKLQTLTNSNPYKNANNLGDIKELYIHLSYLFTYGIGRLKSLQDVCNLFKGKPSTENCSSDGDEDEIEIVEPTTTTIDLDSDTEDVVEIDNEKSLKCEQGKPSHQRNPLNQIVRKPIQTLQGKMIPAEIRTGGSQSSQRNQFIKIQLPSSQTIQQTQSENLQRNLPEQLPEHQDQIGSDDDFNPLSVLACMLEVELTEGESAVKSTTTQKKQRKKVTVRSNPNIIKKKREVEMEKLKRNDLKLKQNCIVNITPLCTDSIYYKETFDRFKAYRAENLGNNEKKNVDGDVIEARNGKSINNSFNDMNNSSDENSNQVDDLQRKEKEEKKNCNKVYDLQIEENEEKKNGGQVHHIESKEKGEETNMGQVAHVQNEEEEEKNDDKIDDIQKKEGKEPIKQVDNLLNKEKEEGLNFMISNQSSLGQEDDDMRNHIDKENCNIFCEKEIETLNEDNEITENSGTSSDFDKVESVNASQVSQIILLNEENRNIHENIQTDGKSQIETDYDSNDVKWEKELPTTIPKKGENSPNEDGSFDIAGNSNQSNLEQKKESNPDLINSDISSKINLYKDIKIDKLETLSDFIIGTANEIEKSDSVSSLEVKNQIEETEEKFSSVINKSVSSINNEVLKKTEENNNAHDIEEKNENNNVVNVKEYGENKSLDNLTDSKIYTSSNSIKISYEVEESENQVEDTSQPNENKSIKCGVVDFREISMDMYDTLKEKIEKDSNKIRKEDKIEENQNSVEQVIVQQSDFELIAEQDNENGTNKLNDAGEIDNINLKAETEKIENLLEKNEILLDTNECIFLTQISGEEVGKSHEMCKLNMVDKIESMSKISDECINQKETNINISEATMKKIEFEDANLEKIEDATRIENNIIIEENHLIET